MKKHPDTAPEQKVNAGEEPIPDNEAAIAAVESARDRDADAYTEAIKRGDFFRDALHALHFCPTGDDYPCKGRAGEPCPYLDGELPDYAACWDEVERRQR